MAARDAARAATDGRDAGAALGARASGYLSVMTDPSAECKHDSCTCRPEPDGFCGDYCREHMDERDPTCGCGHTDCVGTTASASNVG
jgi:hypothetical protein